MKPTPFQVFCGYYLGLDKDFRYRFFNANSLAAHYEIAPNELLAAMDEYRLDAITTRHVDYNIVKAHATAQEISMFGGSEDIRHFARRSFEEFLQARGGFDPKKDFENVDYDHLFPGDAPPKRDEGPDD